MTTFNTEALIRAMHLPIDDVIESFRSEQEETSTCIDKLNEWATEKAQGDFAKIIRNIQTPRNYKFINYVKYHDDDDDKDIVFEPTIRYMRKLLQKYTRLIEQSSFLQIENDDLVEIVMEYQCKSIHNNHSVIKKGMRDDNIPDPTESCHVSYSFPEHIMNADKDDEIKENKIVGIKIYPHHNDVGVRRVWEAGAALAEYLILNKHHLQNKRVCELGAGVGLTGIVIAGLCETKHVHLTDYTNATLDNLAYNCAINYDWINYCREMQGTRSNDESISLLSENCNPIITTGFLEWDDFVANSYVNETQKISEATNSFVPSMQFYDHDRNVIPFNQSIAHSLSISMESDVYIAADVIYDRSVIPPLVQVVKMLLTTTSSSSSSSSPTCTECNDNKIAIFATTLRHEVTFEFFQSEVQKCTSHLQCEYVDDDYLKNMPYIFPCYFLQPRTHVRICIISVKKEE